MVQTQIPQGYTQADKAKDFKKVFFGSDEGKRVFAQIQAFTDPPTFERDADNHGLLAWRAGAKSVMAQILRAMTVFETPTVEREPTND